MAGTCKWNASVKAAKTDSVLKALALSIFKHNGRHAEPGWSPDTFTAGVYRERVEELGMWVPNDAYWSILLGHSMSAARGV